MEGVNIVASIHKSSTVEAIKGMGSEEGVEMDLNYVSKAPVEVSDKVLIIDDRHPVGVCWKTSFR